MCIVALSLSLLSTWCPHSVKDPSQECPWLKALLSKQCATSATALWFSQINIKFTNNPYTYTSEAKAGEHTCHTFDPPLTMLSNYSHLTSTLFSYHQHLSPSLPHYLFLASWTFSRLPPSTFRLFAYFTASCASEPELKSTKPAHFELPASS